MNEFDGVLDPTVVQFVDRHIRSLLAWDVLVYFYRNPDAVLDVEGLCSRLGRRMPELYPEIEAFCQAKILALSGGLIRYRPDPSLQQPIARFVDSCQDRGKRLALIALVLRNISTH